MTGQKLIDLPPDLEETRRRFERWRRTREVRSPIPQPLWTAAAKMARRHGVNRTARALRVNYYTLKERAENEASSASEPNEATAPTFVELAAPAAASTCECILELENVVGTRMRIQLRAIEVPDLAALARSFQGTGS